MQILLSADYHLKLGTKNIPDSWALNRYRILFKQLHDLEEKVDKHIIMGDLFDKIPSMLELEVYFEYIVGCKCTTLIIPGNHESVGKYTTFLTNLKEVTTKLNPLVRIIDDFESIDGIDFIPYNCLKKPFPNTLNNNVLISHCRGAIEPHVKPEIDLDLFNPWKIVFAGDLHSHSNSQRNIVYPGSPLTTSFHRNMVDTGVILLDMETLKWDWIKLEVPQLIRKTIKVGEPMLATDYHHTIYEIEGDMSDLHLVEESDLIDKKISKRDNDTALILNKDMSIQDELNEYLEYILQIPPESIEKVMKEFADSIKEF